MEGGSTTGTFITRFVVIEAMRMAAHETLSPDVEALPLPERVRDIIGRQLDRLDARSRKLVAVASVVGRESISRFCSTPPRWAKRRRRGEWRS